MKLYVTFGTNHNHLVAGTMFNFSNAAEIECETEEEGRQVAFILFGRKFCTTYTELPDLIPKSSPVCPATIALWLECVTEMQEILIGSDIPALKLDLLDIAKAIRTLQHNPNNILDKIQELIK